MFIFLDRGHISKVQRRFVVHAFHFFICVFFFFSRRRASMRNDLGDDYAFMGCPVTSVRKKQKKRSQY